jgi:hypothetical protein
MKDIRSSRVAIGGPQVPGPKHSAASFHDGFVRGRKWFRPPHWIAVRGELIHWRPKAGWWTSDGRRFAAGILPSPGTSYPPPLLFSWAMTGATPSLSTSRSGARPRCLNHCEAAFSTKRLTIANHKDDRILVRNPSGIRGAAPSSGMLQTGQGIPAPPQSQPCGPSQGCLGWFSKTHPGVRAEDAFHGCYPAAAAKARQLGRANASIHWN